MRTRWSIAVVFLCSAELFAGATIEGVVPLPAAPKKPPKDARYQVQTSAPIGKPEPIKAVVYLVGTFPERPKGNGKTAVVQLTQRHYQFSPAILPIEKGTRVEFPNQDPEYHNVLSNSKIKRFDLGRYRKDEKPAAQVFDKPGVVNLYCEIHAHMRGTILVLDTPYFVTTDEQGKFRIENLPVGKFTLKAYVDEKTLEKAVELKEGQTARIDF